jgi:hypothetical protein
MKALCLPLPLPYRRLRQSCGQHPSVSSVDSVTWTRPPSSVRCAVTNVFSCEVVQRYCRAIVSAFFFSLLVISILSALFALCVGAWWH